MTNRNTIPSSTMNQEVYTRSAVSPYPSMYSSILRSAVTISARVNTARITVYTRTAAGFLPVSASRRLNSCSSAMSVRLSTATPHSSKNPRRA